MYSVKSRRGAAFSVRMGVAVLLLAAGAAAAQAQSRQPSSEPLYACSVYWDPRTNLIFQIEDEQGNPLPRPWAEIGTALAVDTTGNGEPDTLIAHVFVNGNRDQVVPLSQHPDWAWVDCVEDAEDHQSHDPDRLVVLPANPDESENPGPDVHPPGGPGGLGGQGGGGGGGQGGSGQPGQISSNPASGKASGPGGADPAAMTMMRSGERNNCGSKNQRSCLPSTLSTALTHDLTSGYDFAPTMFWARNPDDNNPGLEIPRASGGQQGLARAGTGLAHKIPNHSKVYNYTSADVVPPAQDIGVDREVLRTSMAVYTPLSRMQKDFLENRVSRDDYLEAATSLRGVTVMAMGFLDKTLGAGLVAIDQQKNHESMNQLLKQISWTTTRMSNDDAQQAFRDVDEKLEACLEQALTSGKASQEVKNTTRKRVDFTCSEECGPPPGGDRPFRDKNNRAQTGNGSYAYCVCCAETSADLNKLSEGGRRPAMLQADPDNLWTLAERAFFGVMGQVDENAPAYKTLELFKMLFGDVVLKKASDGRQGGADQNSEPYFHYAYQMPVAEPRRVVALYYNRCHLSGGEVLSDLGKSGTDCGLDDETRFLVTKGICPSLMEILSNWRKILDPNEGGGGIELDRLWMEASAGHPLSGRDIMQLLALNGDPASEIRPNTEREIAARLIESWCRSSAVSATARFYTRFKASVIDHLVLSRALTQREKTELLQMIDRYHEYFALTELDANSALASTAALVATSISYDRHKAAHTGSSSSSNLAHATQGAISGGWSVFGGHNARVVADGGQSGSLARLAAGGDLSGSRIFTNFTRDFSKRPSPAELIQSYAEAFGPRGKRLAAELELARGRGIVDKAVEAAIPVSNPWLVDSEAIKHEAKGRADRSLGAGS